LTDFFISHVGVAANFGSRKARWAGAVKDLILDLNPLFRFRLAQMDSRFKNNQARRILAVGIEVPGREQDIHTVMRRLQRSTKHKVEISITKLLPGEGKFNNIQRAIDGEDLETYEWLLIVDDDVAFRPNMLDRLIGASEACEFVISQPAHRLSSYASYEITLRRPGCFARQTRFVEIGPLTAIHRTTFPKLIPFPKSRWAYGIDLIWSHTAEQAGWKMGIIDACPIGHLRPVGGAYSVEAARAEGAELIKTIGLTSTREELLSWEKVAYLS
jgi:hypothetical protein